MFLSASSGCGSVPFCANSSAASTISCTSRSSSSNSASVSSSLARSRSIGSCFAALSGVLLAPRVGLDATILTLLVVQAFGACAVGLFSSLPVTYGGGLVVGVAASLATKYLTRAPWSGVPSTVPFLILIAVLLVVPAARMPARSGGLPSAAGLAWSAFSFQGNFAPLSAASILAAARGMQDRDDIDCIGTGAHYSQVAVRSTKNRGLTPPYGRKILVPQRKVPRCVSCEPLSPWLLLPPCQCCRPVSAR